MKIIVSKLDAAKSQLCTAIKLHFEEGDPVSIHSLASNALRIIHDHFDKNSAQEHGLPLHYHSAYIKDEYRKEWINRMREAGNFFKHADNDAEKSIEFESAISAIFIHDGIRCLSRLNEETANLPEFKIFMAWFMLKHPRMLNENGAKTLEQIKALNLDPDNLANFNQMIIGLKHLPELMKMFKGVA